MLVLAASGVACTFLNSHVHREIPRVRRLKHARKEFRKNLIKILDKWEKVRIIFGFCVVICSQKEKKMIATTHVRRRRLNKRQKMQRLALIKERYRKLVLEPKQQIALEMASELGDDVGE